MPKGFALGVLVFKWAVRFVNVQKTNDGHHQLVEAFVLRLANRILPLDNKNTELAAMQFANAAAAYKCTQPNGRQGAPTKQQLDQFIKEQY